MLANPGQVLALDPRHSEVTRARLVVDNREGADRMTLHVEVQDSASSHAGAIVDSIRDITKLRGDVAFHAPGTLANDGKVIDDQRNYD
jgi:phenylacetate-CoA ligase